MATSSFWHTRFVQQAQWTQNLRRYLYGRANLATARRLLEVGCGTGAVLTELTMQSHGEIYGIDISNNHLDLAASNLPGTPLVLGDSHDLPYLNGVFDITMCHFLILWVHDPVQVVREMVRVTQPGGAVLALAEPDYGGRIDFPPELSLLGEWQQAALRQQGADPLLGRKLRAIFHQAGISEIETGVLGGQWSGKPDSGDWEMEWKILEDDLHTIEKRAAGSDIMRLKNIDKSAWEHGERVLFVPTFYAWGKVPSVDRTLEY